MIGWLIFAIAALACGGFLWLVVRPGTAGLQLIATALLLAAAGYSWQGRPGLPGHPVTPETARPKPVMIFAQERGDWMDSVGPEADILASADVWISRGEPDYAVGILRGYLAQRPNSMMLWIGLGNALVQYADGAVTPAARYAFDRAAALAPNNPAAPYFLGLDYAVSGDLESTEKLWGPVLANAPERAPWRAKLATRLELIRRLRLSN